MNEVEQESILCGKRIATLTLGCKVNQYETDGIQELLEKNGCVFVKLNEPADICLVNTCSVTNMAERKSRQMLHRMKKQNPQAVIVAMGCYVQAAPKELENDISVDLIIGNNDKARIVEILNKYLENQINNRKQEYEISERISKEEIESCDPWIQLELSRMTEHTRAYVKIQDGCNQFCSYCIIPYVRGRIRSRKPADTLAEVRRLADAGCKEVVLTGIHLSSYGKDWELPENKKNNSQLDSKNVNLIRLIEEISQIEGILRIRLGSLEPRVITEEFIAALKQYPKVCPHFHLSLQSGCDATLKRMNRKYTMEEYKESCRILRRAYDRPALTTDIIVGFPGETQEEFDTTCRNLEELNLYEMHVFKYSRRKGTVADRMPDQIPEEEKNRRSERLLAMTAKQKAAYEDSFRGETVQVLLEERLEKAESSRRQTESSEKQTQNDRKRTAVLQGRIADNREHKQAGVGENKKVEKVGKAWYSGHTERYIRVEVQTEENLINCMVDAVV